MQNIKLKKKTTKCSIWNITKNYDETIQNSSSKVKKKKTVFHQSPYEIQNTFLNNVPAIDWTYFWAYIRSDKSKKLKNKTIELKIMAKINV